nr:E3 SUMO-protein ligase ZBED1-like [Nothobranchius furzeri]
MQWFPESSSSRRLLPMSSLKTGEPGTSSPHGRTLMTLSKTLGPLVDFTDALSGEKYVSVSLVKPSLHLFNKSILADQNDDTDLSKSIKKKILDNLNEKYNGPPTQELLDIATALNPRFKMKYSSEVSQESVKARLTREMKEMTETPVMQMPAESDDPKEAKKKRRKKGLGSFFKVPEDTSPGGAGPALHPDEAIASRRGHTGRGSAAKRCKNGTAFIRRPC